MSRLVTRVTPTLDGSAVTLGDGTVRARALRIEAGAFDTPFWLVPDGDESRAVRVNALPWQGVIRAGTVRRLSSAPGAASHNEPAGMTTLADTDGSVIESGGNALGVSWFGAWNIGSGDMANHINVVADAGTVSGSALRLEFNSAYNPNCAQVSGRWGPNYDEIYVRLELLYEAGWNQGHKLFYIHTGAGSSDDIFLTRAANGWMQLNDQAGSNVIFEEFSPLETDDVWYTVELHLTNGAGSGTAKLWVDDVLLQDVSGITWGADGNFQGLEFFYDTEEALTQSFMRKGAFYASGKVA